MTDNLSINQRVQATLVFFLKLLCVFSNFYGRGFVYNKGEREARYCQPNMQVWIVFSHTFLIPFFIVSTPTGIMQSSISIEKSKNFYSLLYYLLRSGMFRVCVHNPESLKNNNGQLRRDAYFFAETILIENSCPLKPSVHNQAGLGKKEGKGTTQEEISIY